MTDIVERLRRGTCIGGKPMDALAICQGMNDAAAEIDRLREELNRVAMQKLSTEMDEQTAEDADFEGGYDTIVEIARKALQPQN